MIVPKNAVKLTIHKENSIKKSLVIFRRLVEIIPLNKLNKIKLEARNIMNPNTTGIKIVIMKVPIPRMIKTTKINSGFMTRSPCIQFEA